MFALEQGALLPNLVRFGTFEVDLTAGELRKNGVKLKLTGQPNLKSRPKLQDTLARRGGSYLS